MTDAYKKRTEWITCLWKDRFSKFFSEGVIATPFVLVDEILNKLPIDWTDPTLTFLDPCCGSGRFLMSIKYRLLAAGHTEQHIIENMIFGMDIDPKNVDGTVAMLGGDAYNHNIKCGNSLTEKWAMKFDVVVGNPPYQDGNTTVKGSRGNLWQKFISIADQLAPIVAFITPDSWLQFRGQTGKWFKTNAPRYVWSNQYVAPYFGVGVTISAWIVDKRQHNTTIDFVDTGETIDTESLSKLARGSIIGTSILNKVMVDASVGIQFQTDSTNNVSWKNDPAHCHLYGETETSDRPYRVCHTARIDCFVANKPQEYETLKVILPLMTRTPKPRLEANIGAVSRMSVYFVPSTRAEGENLITLLTSKVYQFVCHVTNNRNSTTRDWLRQLPVVDLSRSWTDQELYQHFNLTADEIKLIEDTIK